MYGATITKNRRDNGGKNHSEKIREETFSDDGSQAMEEDEESYFDKEVGYWMGTGRITKRKTDDSCEYEN